MRKSPARINLGDNQILNCRTANISGCGALLLVDLAD